MKPNRSNQRTNLVAGTWMPFTLTLLALALVAPNHLYAATRGRQGPCSTDL